MQRALKLIISIASVALAVIGIGGIPDDIQQWADWLGAALTGDVGRWLLVMAGIGGILGANFPSQTWQPLYRRIRPESAATDQTADAPQPIVVEHKGIRWVEVYRSARYIQGGGVLIRAECPVHRVEMSYRHRSGWIQTSFEYNERHSPNSGLFWCVGGEEGGHALDVPEGEVYDNLATAARMLIEAQVRERDGA